MDILTELEFLEKMRLDWVRLYSTVSFFYYFFKAILQHIEKIVTKQDALCSLC